MGSVRVIPFVLVLLAAALPFAVAEPAVVDAAVLLPVRVAGEARLVADAPVLLLQGTEGTATWRVQASELRVAEVEYWEQVTDAVGAAPQSGVRTSEYTARDAVLTVAAREPGFTALAWGADAGSTSTLRPHAAPEDAADPAWTTHPDARVFRLTAPLTISAPIGEGTAPAALVLGRPAPFQYAVPAGDLHAQAADAVHGVDGALEGYLHGGSVTLRHSDGLRTLALLDLVEERPGSVYVPEQGWVGPGTHKERIVRYVQWEAVDAALQVETAGASAAVFAPLLDLDIAGHLAAAQAHGALTLGDQETLPLDADALVLSGAIRARLAGDKALDHARLTASGDVTYVRVGGEASSFSLGTAVAAAAGLALLAGAAMAIWHAFPGVLPLFSRVAKEDVLDHKTRAEIFELVRSEPGVTPHGVVEATGVGWSTVMYHLTVLERSEMVVALKDGRYRRYFDRTSGRFSNGRKDIVAALRNGTTAAIACHIRDHPGLVQRRIAETFNLAASSVHWHVERLVKAGLVEKQRGSRTVMLVPGPGWDKLDPQDLDAVLAR